MSNLVSSLKVKLLNTCEKFAVTTWALIRNALTSRITAVLWRLWMKLHTYYTWTSATFFRLMASWCCDPIMCKNLKSFLANSSTFYLYSSFTEIYGCNKRREKNATRIFSTETWFIIKRKKCPVHSAWKSLAPARGWYGASLTQCKITTLWGHAAAHCTLFPRATSEPFQVPSSSYPVQNSWRKDKSLIHFCPALVFSPRWPCTNLIK